MTMNDLDALYAKLLSLGFVVMKQAVARGDREWLDAELEMLHNVPSLLSEENYTRHQYYWHQERQHYIDWVSAPGREEAKSRMLTFYEPIWQEMEPLLTELFDSHESTKPR